MTHLIYNLKKAMGLKKNTMLAPGSTAPDFTLTGLDGSRKTAAEVRGMGPVLLAVFKASCPTCQFTMPFLDRLNGNGKLPVIAVSQDDPETTRYFNQAFKMHLPTLLDEESRGYRLSNSLGITNVPSMFVIEADGTISKSWMGFSRDDMEAVGERAGVAVIQPGERVPEFRPG